MHLEQGQTELVRIFEHPLLGAIAPFDQFFGPVEGAVEKHQLEPLISRSNRFEPAGTERRVGLALAIGMGKRNPRLLGRPGHVAGLRQRGQELAFLRLGPVAFGRLAKLGLLPSNQNWLRFPGHARSWQTESGLTDPLILSSVVPRSIEGSKDPTRNFRLCLWD